MTHGVTRNTHVVDGNNGQGVHALVLKVHDGLDERDRARARVNIEGSGQLAAVVRSCHHL